MAFIYGSVARMQDRKKSDVDLMIIGDVKFAEVVSALDKALMRETKLFLIGDQRELTRLAKKRVAG